MNLRFLTRSWNWTRMHAGWVGRSFHIWKASDSEEGRGFSYASIDDQSIYSSEHVVVLCVCAFRAKLLSKHKMGRRHNTTKKAMNEGPFYYDHEIKKTWKAFGLSTMWSHRTWRNESMNGSMHWEAAFLLNTGCCPRSCEWTPNREPSHLTSFFSTPR